jgi:hypothetical protein
VSLTDSISQAMAAGVGTAQQEAAAVDHAVEQIATRAAAAGFAGIAVGLARVREVVGQVRARLATIGGVLGEASRSVDREPTRPLHPHRETGITIRIDLTEPRFPSRARPRLMASGTSGPRQRQLVGPGR